MKANGEDEIKGNELQEHIFSTYVTLRYGMTIICAAFPLLLYLIGLYHGIGLENSMSHYYFAPSDNPEERVFPMRVWFVGILFAVGIFFYLYKGFSSKENIALNLAGWFALGVAIFPMNHNCGNSCPPINLHGICAVSLFLCIAFVSLFCAKDTLRFLDSGKLEKKYLLRYRVAGWLMLASPLIALAFTLIFRDFQKYTFFIEASGVWAFAFYWGMKSKELSKSPAEKLALTQKLEFDKERKVLFALR